MSKLPNFRKLPDQYRTVNTPKPLNDTQTFERPGSSPLLHTRFRSPTDSDPARPDSSQTDAPAPENFIDLRESGAYETVIPQNNGTLSYDYTHGVAPIPGHGASPLPQFNNGNLAPAYGQQPASRFSPITPETEDEVDFSSQGRAAYTKNQNGLAVINDDYGEWLVFCGDMFRISVISDCIALAELGS